MKWFIGGALLALAVTLLLMRYHPLDAVWQRMHSNDHFQQPS